MADPLPREFAWPRVLRRLLVPAAARAAPPARAHGLALEPE